MEFLKKRNNKIILIVGIVLISGFFIAQWWAKKYIEDALANKIPPTLSVAYSDLDVNVLRGNISLHNASIKMKSEDAEANHTTLDLEILEIKGVGYWNLLVNNKLSLGDLNLLKPKINYYPYLKIVKEKDSSSKSKSMQFITIDDFTITEGNLIIMQDKKDSIKVSIANYDLEISDATIDLKSMNKLPFDLADVSVTAQKIFSSGSDYETFQVDSLNIEDNNAVITNFQIIPRFSKKELSKQLSKERDYIKLNIPKINLEKIAIQLGNNRLSVGSDSLRIEDPNLEIYRDKMLPDDETIKSLYSKSLRNLNFDLDIKQTKINNAYISYAELIEADKEAGKLFFKNVNATLDHLSNLKESKKTEIKVNSSFMGKAPLELNWSFDVNNKSDAMFVTGSILRLPAAELNPFFKPNLNVQTEGTLQQMYFTFSGNNTVSKGEMKMKYDDFKFEILRKDSSKVNKLLTAIGNVFIKKDSEDENVKDFRFGEIEAERDPTKSFFNYLWINVKSGVVSTLTGDGEKK
ncbi:DUF748 domain-containing protein [Flavobacterium algicola]|uniref:DUF748 domain-containing protein n=1 Tax=Flavobacterium algicola TaxID=556529 RepID=UPI001EFC6706|nr:DUF748 domain-containing protein [Flavobacterium algicola]MCG9791183.1 DUF748 domain-containing protein [Flavobacterium algicola]